MKKFLLIPAAAGVLLVSGCGGSTENGSATAHRISQSIIAVCGTSEGNGNVGPRTITPIDLDGESGPTGYLVTCVNGKTDYVEAVK